MAQRVKENCNGQLVQSIGIQVRGVLGLLSAVVDASGVVDAVAVLVSADDGVKVQVCTFQVCKASPYPHHAGPTVEWRVHFYLKVVLHFVSKRHDPSHASAPATVSAVEEDPRVAVVEFGVPGLVCRAPVPGEPTAVLQLWCDHVARWFS